MFVEGTAHQPTPDGMVGKTFAHFRIERPLGRGGMGDVFLATDLALDRPVALKVLARPVGEDRSSQQRFVHEARCQARIGHPNVCHIYYTGEQDGQLFFAMEYVDGETLQDCLSRQGRIAVGEAVELCRMVALGLKEAQRLGYTHRDIKPSNLMVDRHGVLKVLDFGICKQTDSTAEVQAGGGAPLTLDKAVVLGTPHYMSPEQARGEPVDFRSDIYALGATLHHLVSGKAPFDAPHTLGIIAKHLSEERPTVEPLGRRKAPIDELIDHMMAKRPDDRFGSYDDLLSALELLSPARHRPAGFWVRTFALGIDFLLAGLASIPLHEILSGLHAILIVSTAYSVAGHARWGRTVGKALLEIEVVPIHRGGAPGLIAAAIRWVAQWGLTAAAMVGGQALGFFEEGAPEGAEPALLVLLLVLGIAPPVVGGIAASLSATKRSVWDLAARTQVRYRRRYQKDAS